MLTSSVITASAKNILRDNIAGLSSFHETDWVMYINAALSWIVSADSSANAVTEDIPLVAGTHQKIPAGGIRLMTLWSNNVPLVRERIDGVQYYGTSQVRNTPLSEARDELYNWGAARERTLVANVVFNKDDPTHFLVYPPNNGSGVLKATYAKNFAKVVAVDETAMSIGDEYLEAVVNYVVYRALIRRLESGEVVADRVAVDSFYAKAKEALIFNASADQQTSEKETSKV